MSDNDLGDTGSDPYEFANVIGDGDQPLFPCCTAEFCNEHLFDVSTIGVPSSQKIGFSKPLSGCSNTEEVLPYIENIWSTSRPLIQILKSEQCSLKISTTTLSFNGYALRYMLGLFTVVPPETTIKSHIASRKLK
ncbi:hypothetical protein L3X38_002305 [Prunus dulcis]|uniref:Uncharacterized protein n=1 Tax=Prunus dulcis TaxID=3755 RepID=A0AAD4ZL25_PRUDU|nr:hypothetical protein L3X38_002305 [Prunus dulcis]